jgi:hypothetical protein
VTWIVNMRIRVLSDGLGFTEEPTITQDGYGGRENAEVKALR